MDDISTLLTIAREATAAGAELLTTAGTGAVHSKGDRDFVTELDLEIQETTQRLLRAQAPRIGFRGEETTTQPSDSVHAEQTWVLDPIDGTSNFIHDIPLCAVSLALVHQDRPIVGVIRAPFLGLEYYAIEGRGAYLNGRPITTGRAQHLRDAIISIGDYAVGPGAEAKNHTRLAVTGALATEAERVRMLGSAALDLAWTAEGRTDGCIIMSNKQWDMAAGVLIARESGAVVTDSDGSIHNVRSRHTVAANPTISRKLLQLISTAQQ
ncbi:inositol monophosphatase family protein [Nocardia testacea]|uniref:inositol monophosphatase family protein n=1 Tax=Nocardia testacea TaxID=248551 RepID=UPI00031A2ED3|nr:inositol monophosphatase family protein [Nocardia testacea]